MKALSVTEVSKRFSKCVNRVYSRKESFEIMKLGVPHALLVPPPDQACNTHELADDLARVKLSLEDRRAIGNAIRKGRKGLKSLRNPWA